MPCLMQNGSVFYPVVLFVNGSNAPASSYENVLKHMASWGFVAVGNEDPAAGSGESTSAMLDFVIAQSKDLTQFIELANSMI